MRSLPPIEKIAQHADAPPPKSPYIPVCRAQPKGVVRGLLLSAVVRHIWVHNVEGRDTPCGDDACEYNFHGKHRSRRLKHFLPACHPEMKKRFTMELTSEAWLEYWRNREACVQPARGIVAATWRIGDHPRSPGRVFFDHPATDPGELPEAFDPLEAMYTLWGRDSVIVEAARGEEIPY